MLAVVIVVARWVVQRLDAPATSFKRLGVGIIALGLLLVVEFSQSRALASGLDVP